VALIDDLEMQGHKTAGDIIPISASTHAIATN